MKLQILNSLKQIIANVQNAHSIYTRDEVCTILWGVMDTVESTPEPEKTEPVGRWFTQLQVEEMLLKFGKQIIDSQLDMIDNLDCEVDTDEIELDDEDDFDIQIGSGNRIEIEYTGQFRYNGDQPNVIVAKLIDAELEYKKLEDDVALFMNNELSK